MLGMNMGLWQNTAALSGGPPATPVTFNPTNGFNKDSTITLTNGNLTVSSTTGGGWHYVRSLRSSAAGTTQFEVTLDNLTLEFVICVEDGTSDFTSALSNKGPGDSDAKGVILWYAVGNSFAWILNNGISQSPTITFAAGDKVTVHINRAAGTVAFFKNGVAVGTAVTASLSDYYASMGGQNGASGVQTTTNFAGSFTYGTDPAY